MDPLPNNIKSMPLMNKSPCCMVEEVNTQGSHGIAVLKTAARRINLSPINLVVNNFEVVVGHRNPDYSLNLERNFMIYMIHFGYIMSLKRRKKKKIIVRNT